MVRVGRAAGMWRFPVLGALTAFLPCGWLWGFVVLAMAAPNAVIGAMSLVVFGLGTLPALVLLGETLRRVVVRLGWAPSVVTSLLLMFAGGFSLAQHLGWLPHLAGPSLLGEQTCSHS
jgi:sulfite exporter TauE/SafE